MKNNEEIIRHVVRTFNYSRGSGVTSRWFSISVLFGISSNDDERLCIKHGMDPDEGVCGPFKTREEAVASAKERQRRADSVEIRYE